jgi:hypothetical protein
MVCRQFAKAVAVPRLRMCCRILHDGRESDEDEGTGRRRAAVEVYTIAS